MRCVQLSRLEEIIMVKFNFADRYAEAGLAPTPETIANRQAPADRIVAAATSAMVIDLVGHTTRVPIST